MKNGFDLKDFTDMSDKQHHAFSPSTLQSREACPKYVPSHSESEASLLGSLQHAVVETGEDNDELNDTRAFAAAECLGFFQERAKAYPGCTVIQEVYLPIDDEVLVVDVRWIEQFDIITEDGQVCPGFRGRQEYRVIEHTTAGYLDYGIVSADETEAEIWDMKFGQHRVTPAKDNLQGISYMLGLKKKFPKLQKCRVGFIMPHADWQTEHTFDLLNIDFLYLRVKTVVQRAVTAANAHGDYSMARPNVGTCLFCKLVGECPKVAELIIDIGKKFAPLALPKDISTTALSDPGQVGLGMKLAQLVQVWAEAYRRQASAKAIASDFMPEGYTLVTSQKEKITDARKVGSLAKSKLQELLTPHLTAAFGRAPTAEEYAAASIDLAEKVESLYSITFGKLEKLIESLAPRGQKTKASESFRESLVVAGAVEKGTPFAFLKQSEAVEKTTETKTESK